MKLLVYFGVYFLLGYVLYSTLCAAVGSMVNSEQEAQQMQFLVMMPMILSVIIHRKIFQHPNSPMAVFGSLFPFTAPLVMFSRIAMQPGQVPWLADCAFHCADDGHHLRHDLALRTDLPRGHPHVRQEAELAGNHEMDQIRIIWRGHMDAVGARLWLDILTPCPLNPFA